MTTTLRERTGAEKSIADESFRSTAILIVDDDRNHAETSRDALEMVGYLAMSLRAARKGSKSFAGGSTTSFSPIS